MDCSRFCAGFTPAVKSMRLCVSKDYKMSVHGAASPAGAILACCHFASENLELAFGNPPFAVAIQSDSSKWLNQQISNIQLVSVCVYVCVGGCVCVDISSSISSDHISGKVTSMHCTKLALTQLASGILIFFFFLKMTSTSQASLRHPPPSPKIYEWCHFYLI